MGRIRHIKHKRHKRGSFMKMSMLRTAKIISDEEGRENASLDSQPTSWSEEHIVVSTYQMVN